MKRYSIAQARANFSLLLDAAEAGEAVVIERRGVRFRLEAHRSRRARPGGSLIEYADAAVLRGEWTWDWNQKGLRFAGPPRRR